MEDLWGFCEIFEGVAIFDFKVVLFIDFADILEFIEISIFITKDKVID